MTLIIKDHLLLQNDVIDSCTYNIFDLIFRLEIVRRNTWFSIKLIACISKTYNNNIIKK